jgi:peptidoglycan/LPS O-acetylase OafA/YrhL
VLHHAAQASREFGQLTVKPLELGYLGVDFFFVLSGFIIFHSTVGRDKTLRDYAVARFRRVYLPYWPIGLAVALLYTVHPFHQQWSWLPTLTLLPTDTNTALTVAWTLKHEILFYLLFGLFYFSGLLWPGLGVWALCILCGLQHLAFAPINLEFLFGAAACLLYRSGKAHPALIGCGILIGLLYAVYPERLLIGAMFALLVAPIAQLEQNGQFTVPAWLVVLGATSYSLYLVHYPLISAAVRFSPVLITGVPIALIAGFTYWFLVERKVVRSNWNPEVVKVLCRKVFVTGP